MVQYELQFFDGHAIIDDGNKRIVIDTGAPSTIDVSGSLDLCSRNFRCAKTFQGVTIPQISEMIGTDVTTLLGSDILREYKVLLDYRNQIVQFSEEEIDIDGVEIGISSAMNIPIIEMSIDNRRLRFFLDTGARISYLAERITRNYDSNGIVEDFYPGLGRFRTDYYEIPTVIGDDEFLVRYGRLPSQLEGYLIAGRTDGIIGFDFFNNFKVVLDIGNKKLKYTRH